MRVKVDKSKIIEFHNDLNYNSLEYFATLSEIVVYGLKITSKGSLYILLWIDGQHLIEVSTSFFKIIDNTMPSNWRISIENEISLFPELFYEEDFLKTFQNEKLKKERLF